MGMVSGGTRKHERLPRHSLRAFVSSRSGPVLLISGLVACRSEGRGIEGTKSAAAASPAPTAVSIRTSQQTIRSLTNEAQRAELAAEGLFVDFGTGDQHKYVQGGWRNGWSRRDIGADGSTFAIASARSVSVRVYLEPLHLPVINVSLRLRGRGGTRTVTVLVDGVSVGSARLSDKWRTVRLPLKARPLDAGWHSLTMLFESGRPPARADVDWLWLSRGPNATPDRMFRRVAPLAIGERALRALLAPTSRTYAFHLQPPPEAQLVFDYGGVNDVLFTVRAQLDGGRPQQLFQDRATPGKWREAAVDLSSFAGQALRLELQTRGESDSGWGDPEIMVPRTRQADSPPPPTSRPRGVIMLVMDTARADAFSPFNEHSRLRTPAFDRLATGSAVFLNAYANENWTKPSVATILSGLYPSTHGAKREPDVLSKDVTLLPEILQRRGFATAAFIANGYCSEKFGFRRGWDVYRNYIRENRPSQAEHVLSDALAWLDSNPRSRFFLYIQTIDPHVTYSPPRDHVRAYHPEPYQGPIGPTLDGYEQAAISQGKKPVTAADIRWIRALYDAEISYHDEHLGRFLDALSASNVLDQTLVIVTNDHGEEIDDHGRHGHGHTLYQELIRSPLLMRYPPLISPTRVRAIVESVDLLPTVAELLGLPAQPGLDGVSLTPTLVGRPPSLPTYALAEFLDDQRALMVGRWKLLAGANGWRKLYDLESDPQEQIDLGARAHVARRLCEQHLGEALATPAKAARFGDVRATPRRFRPAKVKQDSELRRQLEALGYFGAM
jgi:choline-sulfatase